MRPCGWLRFRACGAAALVQTDERLQIFFDACVMGDAARVQRRSGRGASGPACAAVLVGTWLCRPVDARVRGHTLRTVPPPRTLYTTIP